MLWHWALIKKAEHAGQKKCIHVLSIQIGWTLGQAIKQAAQVKRTDNKCIQCRWTGHWTGFKSRQHKWTGHALNAAKSGGLERH
jgi:hypothetical protein